jgi:hypothetical protein
MKKTVTAKTKQTYYVANIGGLIIIVGLIVWCFSLSFDNGKIEFTSISFWVAIVLMVLIPFAIISIFSAIKEVVVTETGLTISYRFQTHKNQINFSEIAEFKSSGTRGKLGESFRLILADGRSFEITRSQFDNYDKLKASAQKAVVGKR